MNLSLSESVIRLVVSFVLGGIIGLEREKNNRPAGFRTHIIVAMSSCLAMLISYHMFKEFVGKTNMDPGRMGSYVISGIGFLGAGTIIREGASVKGLTTAASLWASAVIGLAIGSGLYVLSIIMTVLILVTLLFMNKFEYKYVKRDNDEHFQNADKNEDDYYNMINKMLNNNKIELHIKKATDDESEELTYEVINVNKKK